MHLANNFWAGCQADAASPQLSCHVLRTVNRGFFEALITAQGTGAITIDERATALIVCSPWRRRLYILVV
jgi:hypothetical protein